VLYSLTILFKEIVMATAIAELQVNTGYYSDAVSENERFIAREENPAARVSRAIRDKQAILDSLVGITADNPVSLAEARNERLLRH
jgi:hypothetical protein